ncbi:MAG: CapA family protein, partial [Gammaproteobacteria bacterium]|nr:CapA family protein [Gammaproteobacteria bacterium]
MISARTTFFLLALSLLAACATPPEPVVESPDPVEGPDAVEGPSGPKSVAAEAAPTPAAPRRITIASVGDMMIGTDFPQNHLPDDDGVSFLAHVTPTLSAADIAFGNLEGVLMDGGEPVKKCSNPSACYLFRSPTRYAEHYREAGFDVLSLANNHARDFGEEGRTSSMEAIAAAGMHHSGRVDD